MNTRMKETGLLGVLGKFKLSHGKLTYKFKAPRNNEMKGRFNSNLNKLETGMVRYTGQTSVKKAFNNALTKKKEKNNLIKRKTKKKANVYENKIENKPLLHTNNRPKPRRPWGTQKTEVHVTNSNTTKRRAPVINYNNFLPNNLGFYNPGNTTEV